MADDRPASADDFIRRQAQTAGRRSSSTRSSRNRKPPLPRLRRDNHARCSRPSSPAARRTAPRPAEGRGKRRRDARFSGRAGCARSNLCSRGGHRRARCHRDLIEGAERFGLAQLHQFRAARAARTPPTASSSRMWNRATACAVSRLWRPTTTALPWLRSTWTCAAGRLLRHPAERLTAAAHRQLSDMRFSNWPVRRRRRCLQPTRTSSLPQHRDLAAQVAAFCAARATSVENTP